MITVGLTGGIGAGKSEVARLLAERGALVIDADALAREALAPGSAGLADVVEAFGPQVLAADGSLDRAAVARLVFADDAARARLEEIVHPFVEQRSRELIAAAPAGSVVVYDVPLLVEKGLQGDFDLVVVVLAGEATRLERLRQRGMAEDDARARMARQATDEGRRGVADLVIVNDGDREQLAGQVDRVWPDLAARARRAGDDPPR